jgi:hypothetical protein
VVPGVNPVTVIGELLPFAVIPPGLAVTLYPVIVDPPVELGSVKVTVAVV